MAQLCLLPSEVHRTLQRGHLQDLLVKSPSQGGGAVRALRFVQALGEAKDYMPAVVFTLTTERSVPPRLVLVHFLLHKAVQHGLRLDPEHITQLQRLELGLKALQVP